jgi:hypothetical protein
MLKERQMRHTSGRGPADRVSETSDTHDRAHRASPSYVEAVLFGRRPRGPSPKPTAQTRKTPGEKAGAANEQEGIEPCAS